MWGKQTMIDNLFGTAIATQNTPQGLEISKVHKLHFPTPSLKWTWWWSTCSTGLAISNVHKFRLLEDFLLLCKITDSSTVNIYPHMLKNQGLNYEH